MVTPSLNKPFLVTKMDIFIPLPALEVTQKLYTKLLKREKKNGLNFLNAQNQKIKQYT